MLLSGTPLSEKQISVAFSEWSSRQLTEVVPISGEDYSILKQEPDRNEHDHVLSRRWAFILHGPWSSTPHSRLHTLAAGGLSNLLIPSFHSPTGMVGWREHMPMIKNSVYRSSSEILPCMDWYHRGKFRAIRRDPVPLSWRHDSQSHNGRRMFWQGNLCHLLVDAATCKHYMKPACTEY